jgi:hypothetical protein
VRLQTENTQERLRFGLRARAKVLEKYVTEKQAPKLMDVIAKVAVRGRPPI